MIDGYQKGKVLDWTNGTGNAVSSGDPVVIGGKLGVAMAAIANGATGSVLTEEVVSLDKTAPETWAVGDRLYYDVSTAKLTTTPKAVFAGFAAYGAAEAATTGYCKLAPTMAPQVANVTFTAGTNLVGVDGTGSNAAPLVGTESRLDALDAAVAGILTAMKAAGVMAPDA